MIDHATSQYDTTGQQEGRAVAGSGPSFGAAADRAAAHQFARSLSHKTSLPASTEKQGVLESPFAEADSSAPSGAGLNSPQQGVGAGVGAPPSMNVRTLSRHFSEKTQQSQIARSARNYTLLVLMHCCVMWGWRRRGRG